MEDRLRGALLGNWFVLVAMAKANAGLESSGELERWGNIVREFHSVGGAEAS